MKLPRVSISAIMATVVVLAVDFAAIRSVHGRVALDERFGLVLLGALPMANIMALALTAILRRPGRRPFLVGFVVSGLIAIAIFAALACTRPDQVLQRMERIVEPLLTGFDESMPHPVLLTLYFAPAVAILVAPQLALALFGGVLARSALRGQNTEHDRIEPAPPYKLRPLLAPLLLVIIPVAGFEGYLRWTHDPATARLRPGTQARIDFAESMAQGFAEFRKVETAATLDESMRVCVDSDDESDQLAGPTATGGIINIRPVDVTLLDGPRRGSSARLFRCNLRPIP